MTIFETIISPFIFLIKHIFLFSYELTGNYGISIVLLSFVVSLLLLPVFIYIEKHKKKDDIVKQKMKPLIDEIKRVYKGQERYYYIKTINRQHNYSSFKALIPILSLLLQIPFFIAAYQFLESYEPLKEVSFAIIKDLSKPDGILGVVNILPIIMTIVNLLTAYFYTINGDGSERKQMLIVAIAFLILLFDLPSGLVLYWTMNNVFSFLRLFITNPEVFKNRRKIDFKSFVSEYRSNTKILIKLFKIILVLLVVVQLIWAFKHYFSDFHLRLIAIIIISILFTIITGVFIVFYKRYWNKILKIKINPLIYFLLLVLTLYFYYASKFYIKETNFELSLLAILFLLPLQFSSYIYFYSKKESTKYYNIIYRVLIGLLLFQVINIYSILANDILEISFFEISINNSGDYYLGFIAIGLISSIISGYKLFNLNSKLFNIKYKWTIFILSSFYLVSVIFIWNPIVVFSSSPESFGFLAIDIIKTNLDLFLYFFFGLLLIFVVIPKKSKGVFLYIIIALALISFIYNSLFPIDVGTLQMHRFSKIENLEMSNLSFLIEALLLFAIFFGIYTIIKKKYFKIILYSFIILNIVTIATALYLPISTGYFSNYSNDTGVFQTNKKGKQVSISFSKTQKNVVVVILDMFQGYYLQEMLNAKDEYKSIFSGFVWYPNTVSVTNYTSSSAPSILAGFDYTPDKLDLDSTKTLVEKTGIAHQKLINDVKEEGYTFYSSDIPYSSLREKDFENYIPLWDTVWDKLKPRLGIGIVKELEYSVLWQNALFFSVPNFAKSQIYKNGDWLFMKETTNENTAVTKHYNFLRALPYISNTKSTKPSFIYIWSKATHFPWDIVDDNGMYKPNVSPYENNIWGLEKMALWINWMKENDVYDNTKIIFLSDHGIRDIKAVDSIMRNNPYTPKSSKVIPMEDLLHFNPLLMVKDYNSTGNIKNDNRFMSNVDTYYIALDKNNPTKSNPPLKRTLTATLVSWRAKPTKDKKIQIERAYEIKTNIFDLNNWNKTFDVNNKTKKASTE